MRELITNLNKYKMKRIEQYIKEEMKDCPLTQEQEDKLLIGLTKFLDQLEQKQLLIHGVVKSLPTDSEMTIGLTDSIRQAIKQDPTISGGTYGIGFVDGYRWTKQNIKK